MFLVRKVCTCTCIFNSKYFLLGPSSLQAKTLTVNSLLLELQSVSSKWYELALALGVSDDELEEIQSQYRNASPNRCMSAALRIWLKTSVHASWSEVVNAVSSSVVGDKRLAGAI